MEQFTTVATLIFLLMALITLWRARRDAADERAAARKDTESIREEARAMLGEAQRREERVARREKDLSADARETQTYARVLEERSAAVAHDEARLAREREHMREEAIERLAAMAQLTPEQARAELMDLVRTEIEDEAARATRAALRSAKADADRRAREILVEAMQRQAGAVPAQAAITRIELPSDEMKGRVIGREGRNIRAFESITGVNVIVEEGANAVHLSSFDVERREVATVTLQALVDDGRIQPHRIEQAYAKAVDGAPQRALEAALDAVEAAGVKGVHKRLLQDLGRLRLRTSYGQTVLDHLVETAQIAGSIATFVGADADLARRAAFLHDIGKAHTGERPGTHAAVGALLAREVGESEDVVNAIAAHHDEVPQRTLEAVIVQIADAISAARPGARRDDADSYVERMEALEKLVAAEPGVDYVYAMAAGRELRVVVQPHQVDDAGIAVLARKIAAHIEKDFSFAGEIKVTVVRETRADSVAGQA